MKILAVGAHPDDLEIACSGTLALCKKRGDEITIVNICSGDMGHKVIMPDELRDVRLAEAKKSASILGVKYVNMGVGDGLLFDQDARMRDAMIVLLKEEKPNLIITHSPNDYMPDHVAASNLVFAASFASTFDHYQPYSEDVPLAPIAYMDNLGGTGFVPEIYVDISSVIDQKLSMLECHISQLKWMRDHDKIDFAEFVKSCSRSRGLQCGVLYAEGFKMCNSWGRIVPRRLLP